MICQINIEIQIKYRNIENIDKYIYIEIFQKIQIQKQKIQINIKNIEKHKKYR